MDERIYVRKDYRGLAELLSGERQVFMVYDRNVSHLAAQIAPMPGYAVDAVEAVKTMDTVLDICRWLMESGADRGALLLALGGGLTSDVAGFAASIYKRGMRYATLPTTLLAQVDAGIGGKTGVNLDSYKNMLGCIRQPEFVYIAADALDTLPEREYRSGVAELLKTFIIADAPRYRRALSMLSSPGGRVDEELIRAAARIKESIVEKDEQEEGLRRKLNLGHTLAHALEWWRPGTLTHGEAVAVGTVMAARVSEALGVCRKGLAAQLESDFAAVGLPTQCPAPVSELVPAIGQDKKGQGDGIHYVLIRDIGSVEVSLIPKDRLLGILNIVNI